MSHPVARQSAQEGLQDKAQAARAGNTACKIFMNHETRDPSHETRLLCFARITRHETRITAFLAVRFAVGAQASHHQKAPPGPPHPPARSMVPGPRLSSMTPNIPQKCTKSRIPQKNRCLPARFCPRWPDVARWVGVSRCPRTVSASRPASRRAPFAGNPTKMHKIPDPAEKCEKRALRRSSRSPAGCFHFVERQMNPCCE